MWINVQKAFSEIPCLENRASLKKYFFPGLPNHLGYSLAREITDDEIEKMQKFHTGTMDEKERSQRQIKEKQCK